MAHAWNRNAIAQGPERFATIRCVNLCMGNSKAYANLGTRIFPNPPRSFRAIPISKFAT